MAKKTEASPLLGPSAADHALPPLSVWRKLAFGSGGMSGALTNVVVGFFFQTFLLEVAFVTPFTVSAILFLGRGWDAITDPVVGFLAGRTHTRMGQYKPWLLASFLPTAILYMGLWVVPDLSRNQKFWYYLVVYLAFQTAFSCFQVPYTSLTIHLSHSPQERDSATAYRMAFEILSAMFASTFQGIIISQLRGNTDETCRPCDGGDDPGSSVDTKEERAYLIAAACISFLSIVSALVVTFGVKELPHDPSKKNTDSFWTGIKLAMKMKSYRRLMLLYLWVWMGAIMIQSNFILYFKYVLDREKQFQNFIITLFTSTVCAIPFWAWVMGKIGKRLAYMAGMGMFVPVLFCLYLLPSNTPSVYIHIACGIGGFAQSSAYLIPWAMLPTVIDECDLKTGVRRESLFFSFFVFFQKLAVGLALALSTVALGASGYISDPCCDEQQPKSVERTLRLMLGIVPAALASLSCLFGLFYPISTEREMEIKRLLAERRALETSDLNGHDDTTAGGSGVGDALALDSRKGSAPEKLLSGVPPSFESSA